MWKEAEVDEKYLGRPMGIVSVGSFVDGDYWGKNGEEHAVFNM